MWKKPVNSITGATVEVRGLDERVRDLRYMDKQLKYELQKVIDDVGNEMLAPHIRNSVVVQRGLIGKPTRPDGTRRKRYRPGGLQRTVRAKVKRGSLQGIIESRAKRKGYPYPVLYEYGDGGRRSFLRAGLRDKAGQITQALDDGLFEVIVRNGWTGRP